MNRQKLLTVLESPKSSKEQLRQALAVALGVDFVTPDTNHPTTCFVACKQVFLDAFKKQNNFDYYFAAKDASALSELIKKVSYMNNEADVHWVIHSFKVIIERLPVWYRENSFSLPAINKNLNTIITLIKHHSNDNKTTVSTDYKQRVLDDLQS